MNAVPTSPVLPELSATGPKSSPKHDKSAGQKSDEKTPSFISTLRQVNRDEQPQARSGRMADDETQASGAAKTAGSAGEGQPGEAVQGCDVPVDHYPKDPEQLVLVANLPPQRTTEMEGVRVSLPADGEMPATAIEIQAQAENDDGGEVPEGASGSDAALLDAAGRQHAGQTISKPVPPETAATPSKAPAVSKPIVNTIHGTSPEMRLTAPGDELLEGSETLQAPSGNAANGLAKPAGESPVPPDTIAVRPETAELAGAVGRKPDQPKTLVPTELPKPEPSTDKDAKADRVEPVVEALDDETQLPPRHPAMANTMMSANDKRPNRLPNEQRTDWLPPVDRGVQALDQRGAHPPLVEKELSPPTDAFRENNVAQIVERIAVSVRGNQSEARIVLKPDHLGSIRLQIATENNTVSVRIMTEFSMARDLLESHLPQLKMELQQQGMEVDEFSVTLSEEQHQYHREERPPQGYAKGGGRKNNGHPEAGSDQPAGHGGDPRPRMPRERSSGVDYFA